MAESSTKVIDRETAGRIARSDLADFVVHRRSIQALLQAYADGKCVVEGDDDGQA